MADRLRFSPFPPGSDFKVALITAAHEFKYTKNMNSIALVPIYMHKIEVSSQVRGCASNSPILSLDPLRFPSDITTPLLLSKRSNVRSDGDDVGKDMSVAKSSTVTVFSSRTGS